MTRKINIVRKILHTNTVLFSKNSYKFLVVSYRMVKMDVNNDQTISEGLATVKTLRNVFYNPVQEFNRDLRFYNA